MHHGGTRVKRILIVSLAWLGLAAGSGWSQEPPTPLADVTLERRANLPEAQLLDVGIAVFDVGLDEGIEDEPGAYPKVRKVESTFLPVTAG